MTTPQCLADGMPTSLCEAALPPQRTEPLVARRWISHLEGRTLVEGIAEAFRHPEPDCPDPIAELQSISDEDMERICGDFVRRTYPEGKFSSDERERMGHAFRHRFIEGSRDAHAHFRREIAELQATLSDAAMQMYAGALARAALALYMLADAPLLARTAERDGSRRLRVATKVAECCRHTSSSRSCA